MNKLYFTFLLLFFIVNNSYSFTKRNEDLKCMNSLCIVAPKSSTQNGNWTTGSTWGGSAPSGSDAITVNHNVVVNTDLSISGSLTVAAGGTLIDAVGGTNWKLEVVNNGVLSVYGNTTFGGTLLADNSSIIHVYGCATLTVGAADLKNNTQFIVDACATVVINGNLVVENSNAMTINGVIFVNGNVSGQNSASSTGTGGIQATGTITSNNSSNFFGNSTTNCTTPPCYANAGGIGTGVLPVTFTKFYAKEDKGYQTLLWQTASEQNNSRFEVQRSNDGVNFEVIGEVLSKGDASGNSSVLLDYSFDDRSPIIGFSYYRLKQIDFNGKYDFTKIISVTHEKQNNVSFIVYPNPNKGEFSIDFKGIENNHEILVNIIDMNGKIVYETIIYPESISGSSFKIIPNIDLPSGKYLVRMQIEGVSHTVKMLVE